MAKILKRRTEKVKSSDSIRVRLSNVESSITDINNNSNITANILDTNSEICILFILIQSK